jgi:23S rRNA (adenine2503-C2)-methyltransferase
VKPLAIYRKDDLASVHVLSFGDDATGRPRLVEAVESVQPPIPRERKWVLIVSTLFGCPIGCAMCDAGGEWSGPLSARQILDQIDYLVRERHPQGDPDQAMLKIQFARMGEPALNPAVLDVLRALPALYPDAGLLPSLSTVAPVGCGAFFDELVQLKGDLYDKGRFQLQFSVHTTDPVARRRVVPARCWSMAEVAEYGRRFHAPGDRKVTLNFAACAEHPIEAARIADHFDPETFLIKVTPLNPTTRASSSSLSSWIDPQVPDSGKELVEEFERLGFQVILSVGEVEENAIGSNCGQFVSEIVRGQPRVRSGYESPRYASELR